MGVESEGEALLPMSTAIKETDLGTRLYQTAKLPTLIPTAEGDAKLFFNRELSLLHFHERVLAEASDLDNPLLERLRFLAIFSANLDEFFMIRVSGLKEAIDQNVVELSSDGMTPAEQLTEIRQRVQTLIRQQTEHLTSAILPELRGNGIQITTYAALEQHERLQIDEYFTASVLPVLTPLAVDRSHPFPFISPLSLNLGLIVTAPTEHSPADPPKFKFEPRFVRIKVPSLIPRLLPVGLSATKFILLEDVIEANTKQLFPGLIPGPCYRFRVTRDADIDIREAEASDLLSMIQEELRKRKFGSPVRLEVSADMPAEMIENLSESLELNSDDVYPNDGPLAIQDFSSLCDIDRPDLKYQQFTPAPSQWTNQASVFQEISANDILVHHPYDAYDCVTEFINAAVEDKDVVAIKMCLYRTGAGSPIPPALIRASEQGKQVTTLIELKARFDEEPNIEWARQLDEAGVHVVYGIIGLKTHSKLTLVVRREGDALKRYVHIASGNYNPTTSCTYTDVGLFTADPEIGADATDFFNYLTGCSRQTEYRTLMVAPVNLQTRMTHLIDREIEHAREGRGARIAAKFNRLADKEIIQKLYEASNAGVKIDLVVRGICMLRPGVPGLSENITVRNIVGRFLEHSRVFHFMNGGDDEVYIGSADWMSRNLKHRIEVVAPVKSAALKNYLKDIVLPAYFRDNVKAHELTASGDYVRVAPGEGEAPFDSQTYFIGRTANKLPGNAELKIKTRVSGFQV